MTTRSPLDPAPRPEPGDTEVRLTAAQAHRVATILGLVEDFFTHHAGPGVRSALGRFASAEGWGEGWGGPRAAAGLIDEVLMAAEPLHRGLRATWPATGTQVNP